MGSTSPDHLIPEQLTVARALEIVRNSDEGQLHPSVNAVLERAFNELWRRIQAQPTTYVMNKDEFTIFNRYRSRFSNLRLAEQAVARFWNNFRGDPSGIDGYRQH